MLKNTSEQKIVSTSFINDQTRALKPYPMEQLRLAKIECQKKGLEIYDFGTGDPRVPLWPPIAEAARNSINPISQYPTTSGSTALTDACRGYLKRRFDLPGVSPTDLGVMATRGSKEAIFHVNLSLVGQRGKDVLIYPNPGYPVYKASAVLSKSHPYPVLLEGDGLLKPWDLPLDIQNRAYALWINYPHNPTAYECDLTYLKDILDWGDKFGCFILSDECYVDLYDYMLDSQQDDTTDRRPPSILQAGSHGCLAFFSLSKRSGMTGFRSGFMAGDPLFMKEHFEARANFGVGSPEFIEQASIVAWSDDQHVIDRRILFSERVDYMTHELLKIGYSLIKPKTTFYLWIKVPGSLSDVVFCESLAKEGVIATPSAWLGEDCHGYFRLSMAESIERCTKSVDIFRRVFP